VTAKRLNAIVAELRAKNLLTATVPTKALPLRLDERPFLNLNGGGIAKDLIFLIR
jgi:hypothetical protein